MSSSLFIKRPNVNSDKGLDTISLEEWISVVKDTNGLRLFDGKEHCAENKLENITISIPSKDGDCEVYFPSEDKWIFVFRWYKGSICFKDNVNFDDDSDPVLIAIQNLTLKLNAVIKTEDGEIINIKSGKI